MLINTAGRILQTTVNGPGVRTLVHFQGCTIRCPGCFNQWSWKVDANQLFEPADLAEELLLDNNQISISGGEPMDQPGGLASLVRSLRRKDPDCSILLFTGYTPAQLDRKVWWGVIRKHLDIVVAGPYKQSLHVEGRQLIGSSNQEILLLSSRYTMEEVTGTKESVEAHIAPDGTITLTGFPPEGAVRALRAQE